MTSERRSELKKRLEILRWLILAGDFAVAAVIVLLAEDIGDIAYIIATVVVIGGLAYFTLWPRLFRSSYAGE